MRRDIVTPNGKIRSLLIRDPDGYVIEVVESAPPADANAPGNVFGASMGLTVADMESTMKFYHGLLGFNLKGKMEFSNDPPIVDLIGAPHAQFRELTATVPGTKALIAFYEYKGIPDAVSPARSRSWRARHCPARHRSGRPSYSNASSQRRSDIGSRPTGSVQPNGQEYFC